MHALTDSQPVKAFNSCNKPYGYYSNIILMKVSFSGPAKGEIFIPYEQRYLTDVVWSAGGIYGRLDYLMRTYTVHQPIRVGGMIYSFLMVL